MGWEAGMLGCKKNIELLNLQAFQPPSFKPTKPITPNRLLTQLGKKCKQQSSAVTFEP
jgi:hypothetical protein